MRELFLTIALNKLCADIKLYRFVSTTWRTHNMGLNEMAGKVLGQIVVHLIIFGAERQGCASYPPQLQALNRYAAYQIILLLDKLQLGTELNLHLD